MEVGERGAARLDIDELLRLELGRAEDAHALEAGVAGTLDGEEAATREQWRREKEDACLRQLAKTAAPSGSRSRAESKINKGGARYEYTEAALRQHMRSASSAMLHKHSHLADYLCLGTWGDHAGEASLEGLVDLSRAHMSEVLGSDGGGPAPTRASRTSRRPGLVARRRVRSRAMEAKERYNVGVLQRAVRAFLVRRRAQRHAAQLRIARWYVVRRSRHRRLRELAGRHACRLLCRRRRRLRLRRRSTLVEPASGLRPGPPLNNTAVPGQSAALLELQATARMWLAQAALRDRRWEASLRSEARLMRAWRRSYRVADVDVLVSLAEGELGLEKQLLEVAVLRRVERQRCERQYGDYEQQLTQHMRKAKLPPGWVRLEESAAEQIAGADSEAHDERSELEDEDDANGKTGKGKSKSKRRSGIKSKARPRTRGYKNLETGRVTKKHPNETKLGELKARQRARAEEALEAQVEQLDNFASILCHEHVIAVQAQVSEMTS